jgi:type IV pilus assembly protein PilX
MNAHGFVGRQSGATLIVVLLILLVVLLFGAASAQMALQGERMERNERDRCIAFEAAEATLLDAEMDIEASPDAKASRSALFSRYSALGFPAQAGSCADGAHNPYLGLCRAAAAGEVAVWRSIDFSDATENGARSIAYGRFTGQHFPLGSGTQPARVPRYIVELLPDLRQGESAERIAYLYRITAVGYGANPNTQVALQSIYRKTR